MSAKIQNSDEKQCNHCGRPIPHGLPHYKITETVRLHTYCWQIIRRELVRERKTHGVARQLKDD